MPTRVRKRMQRVRTISVNQSKDTRLDEVLQEEYLVQRPKSSDIMARLLTEKKGATICSTHRRQQGVSESWWLTHASEEAISSVLQAAHRLCPAQASRAGVCLLCQQEAHPEQRALDAGLAAPTRAAGKASGTAYAIPAAGTAGGTASTRGAALRAGTAEAVVTGKARTTNRIHTTGAPEANTRGRGGRGGTGCGARRGGGCRGHTRTASALLMTRTVAATALVVFKT